MVLLCRWLANFLAEPRLSWLPVVEWIQIQNILPQQHYFDEIDGEYEGNGKFKAKCIPKMLELSDAELGLETMGLLMGKLMKNTQNLTIQPDYDEDDGGDNDDDVDYYYEDDGDNESCLV